MDVEGALSSYQLPESSLRAQSRALLADLGFYDDSHRSAPAPITIPRIIFDHAFSDASDASSTSELLNALSFLIAYEGISLQVIHHFRPLAVDLFARWLGAAEISDEEWERRFVAIATYCAASPDLWGIAIAFILESPFRASPFALLPIADLEQISADRLHALLLAYLRLITADPNIAARYDWSATSLHALRTQHEDGGLRLLAIRILAARNKWSEVRRQEMERECVGDVSEVDAPVCYGVEIIKLDQGGFELRRKEADGWLIPLLEAKRIEALHGDASRSTFTLTPNLIASLSPRPAVVADSLLLRSSLPTPVLVHGLIHVSTSATEAALRELAPLLSDGRPVLLSSPPSSGKTHILQYLSTLLHPSISPTNRILTIPLADTTIDVKSVIGTYISSPTRPGTFEWMEGALAKAVRSGRWVVFDDIDRASMEMLVTIAGIARSLRPGRAGRRAKLAIPGREDIEAGDGFAIFATRSLRGDAWTPPTFFSHYNFSEVQLAPPTDSDILAILNAQFGSLPSSALTTLIDIWRRLSQLEGSHKQGKSRDIGLRDLEKWCARVQANLPRQIGDDSGPSDPFANPVFQDEVLLEAADVFMAALDSKADAAGKREEMVRIVAAGIDMDEERALSVLNNRKPTLEVASASSQLLIGRTVTPVAPSSRRWRPQTSSRPFALTKPSLVLLERIASTANMGEPTLLVGETGTGKTTAVQYIADACRRPLTVLNLSMQTESSDLLGGFKPIDASISARSLHARWQKLFTETFSMGKSQNGAYLEAAAKALSARKWARCAELWSSSARRAIGKLAPRDDAPAVENGDSRESSPRKRRKVNTKAVKAAVQWQSLLVEVSEFDLHHVKMNSKLVFSFVEGPLVKAMQSGEWILLDEVNLASQETLEAISTILEGPTASLVLTERGDLEPIKRHPDFRLFACMNPATDVGKKDLPPNLRNRFTELYVPPPDDDREALISIITGYIGDAAAGEKAVILDVVEMYSTLKRLSASKEIVDGSNAAPHYSMRTLARALSFAVETAPLFGLRRGLWEGCLMAFTMSLDVESAKIAHAVCEKYLIAPLKNARAVLSQIPSLPAGADPDDWIRFGAYWLRRGPLASSEEMRYIITPSVQAKLSDLARVILTRRYPVLIQGPTSAGKTSAVEFLARQTGHRFVRINNHEHTDIQEYLGTYVTDPQSGNLVFQEGLLVTAVRQGHWIVLDELNLAPTDVLEALNRLLDDNRELVIPETQEVVRPHPNFILFATQNPPGLYAGRKVLSRAFRNRFLEVHFDDVPKDELEAILCQRCQIAPSYAKKIVQVFEELRHRRQASRVFESKSSFATLRDLFRWAERGAVGYQQLAEDGYMLLAERARQDEDKMVIKQVIEDIMKVTIAPSRLYDLFDATAAGITSRLSIGSIPTGGLVWTKAMQRLFILVAAALHRNEPVLLVGETGCGKTSVCEVIAQVSGQALVGVNCHQNMETADLLGSQRPVRNRQERKARIITALSLYETVDAYATEEELARLCDDLLARPDVDRAAMHQVQKDIQQLSALFEWSDGPLVHAMTSGDLLLLDEVSLADDSVLERLNSVLEPGRTLVLAEKGGNDLDAATIVANPAFHVVATMNPGGDFGKKELSPALRNRFTEIWVPPLTDRDDLSQIIRLSWKNKKLEPLGVLILKFFEWFTARLGDQGGLGLRDLLAWVNFADYIFAQGVIGASEAFHHGGQMAFVDGLESLPQISGMTAASVEELRRDCFDELLRLASSLDEDDPAPGSYDLDIIIDDDYISISSFRIKRGPHAKELEEFRFEAPTTAINAMRVLRGAQLPKAILLEGSPGVGKTSLVSALAAAAGHRLQRVNLSDQTDLIDLFGSDLPVEGGQAGEFQWRDAAFLDAMQRGDWVLLDEMNLASQTVLEGLNAVLDHRGTVYIPELGRSFERHPDFRVFAAQNPLQQGGGRKGLPKSFLNRFTKVYLQEHTAEDLLIICRGINTLPEDLVEKMISFNEIIRQQIMITRQIGTEGSPWEFNLRDLFRWFKLLAAETGLELVSHPAEFIRMVYLQRFRNPRDRQAVEVIFGEVFGTSITQIRPQSFIASGVAQIGHSIVRRGQHTTIDQTIEHEHLDVAESVLKAVELGWLVILAGDSGIGKRSLVQAVASAAGHQLGEFSMHPGVDTSEMLGSFEQQDPLRSIRRAYSEICEQLEANNGLGSYADELKSAFDKLVASKDGESVSRFLSVAAAAFESLPPVSQHQLRPLLSSIAKRSINATGFEWIDGELLKAIRHGGWFLVSNANLCSASVLDRLNSLCETNGVLVMSEKGSTTGSPEVIEPHPGFRLFMTYNPKYGELSRAMRNRGVELHVDSHSSVRPNLLSPSLSMDSRMKGLQHADLINRTPSDAANLIASSTSEALTLLRRSSVDSRADGLQSAIVLGVDLSSKLRDVKDGHMLRKITPLDASLNPNVPASLPFVVFRAMQVALRNQDALRNVETFVADPVNNKMVLSVSASAHAGGSSRRKVVAGQGLYPFMEALRKRFMTTLATIIPSTPDPQVTIAAIEELHLLTFVLEKHSQQSAFNYSSTQLLAAWIGDTLRHIPVATIIRDQLAALASSSKVERGLGQSAIWSLFLEGRLEPPVEYSRLLKLAETVQDPALRRALFFALVNIRSGQIADVFAIEQLIGSIRKNDRGSVASLLAEDHAVQIEHAVNIHSSHASPSSWFDCLTSALQLLWDQRSVYISNLQGPAVLFKPAQLATVLRFGKTVPIRLRDIPDSDAALSFTTKAVLLSTKDRSSNAERVSKLAIGCLLSICSAFGATIQADQCKHDATQILRRAALPDFVQGILQDILPVVERYQCDMSNTTDLPDLLIAISRFLLTLFVPEVPIDPAVRRTLLGELAAYRLQLLEAELLAVEKYEVRVKGVSDSRRRSEIMERIGKVQADRGASPGERQRVTEVTRLAAFFGEIYAYTDDIDSEASIDALLLALRSSEKTALLREEAYQLSTGAFIQRLSVAYSDLDDLARPTIFALELNRLALRIAATACEQRHVPAVGLAAAITNFPHPISLEYVKGSLDRDVMLATATFQVRHLLNGTLSVGQRDARLYSIMSSIDRIYQTWSSVRVQERLDQQEAESLYRVRKTDIEVLGDEELEAKELAELFPVFNEDPPTIDFSPKKAKGFDQSHILAFRDLIDNGFRDRATSNDSLQASTDAIIAIDSDLAGYGEDLDTASIPFQIAQLHRRTRDIQAPTGTPNFYFSPNEPEARKAHHLVDRLRTRLTRLIAEWPEQVVLQHLRDRCDRALLLDVRSPVAQILATLEQLLLHTNDWESYANKENSLSAFQASVSALIIEWRRLELSSWMRLLDDQFIQYKDKDAEWSLRLYGTLVHDAVSAESIEKYIDEILPMLNTFLQGSTFGHFESRIKLLHLFASGITEIASMGIERFAGAAKVSLLLHNLANNAALFLPQLNTKLSEQRKTLDKSIKDYVKLASWKDVNVFALKASAEKSHRHLHRSIRKFRELLQQPVAAILSDLNSIVPQESTVGSEAPTITSWPLANFSETAIVARAQSSVPIPPSLADISAVFGKFSQLHGLYASSASAHDAAISIDDMAIEIIETAASLAKATPASLTKENTKIVANLAARKRKAYADMLKALRASGFSANVPADQLARQQSATWIASQPVLQNGAAIEESHLLTKVQSYHKRLVILMSALRAAFNGHNDDIASPDLQRGIGFTESLYALALRERSELHTRLGAVIRLRGLLHAVGRIRDSAAVSGCENLKPAFHEAEVFAGNALDCLSKLMAAMSRHRELENKTLRPDEVDFIEALKNKAENYLHRLAATNQIMRKSECAIYNGDDMEILIASCSFKEELETKLAELVTQMPDFAYLLEPSIHYIAAQPNINLPAPQDRSDVPWEKSDAVIQALLVVTQELDRTSFSHPEDERLVIPDFAKYQRNSLQALRLSAITDSLFDFVRDLAARPSADSVACLNRVLPFIEVLNASASDLYSSYVFSIKSLCKLTYVVGRVVLDLAQKGYCRPQEESQGDNDGAEGETVEGTGMGAGTGDKNVSSEIKDESQVEGLQGEEDEEVEERQKGKDDDEKNDNVDMENDFEGALEDREDGDDEAESGDEEEDHDEHAGGVDPLDPGAVDEKFWGDEEDGEKEQSDELMNQKTEQKEGESEMTAKEDDSQQKKDTREDAAKVEEEDTQHDNTQHDDTQDDDSNENDEVDDNAGDEEKESGVQQDAMNVEVPESEMLDLPEDLDMGEAEDDDRAAEDDISLGPDEEAEQEPEVQGDDASMASQDDGEQTEDGPDATGIGEEDTMDQEEPVNQNLDLTSANDAEAEQSADGKGVGGSAQDQSNVEPDSGEPQAQEADSNGPAGPSSAFQAQQSAAADQDQAEGPVDSSGAPLQSQSGSRDAPRSLGDIMEEIKRRRDEILAQQERLESIHSPDTADQAPGQVEYLHDGDADEGQQALGTADEDQRQRLQDLNIVDDETADREQLPGMDDTDEQDADQPTNSSMPTDRTQPPVPSEAASVEKALTYSDVKGKMDGTAPQVDGSSDGGDEFEATEVKPDITDEDEDMATADLTHAAIAPTDSHGEEVWRRYASMTSDLSYALCEQLRLILEPTLATRLQGDFRTGKRLNMRKIIPYIASEYTKDKIWLRRTKPSRREYQVLLSIDDSGSMAESHSVHLAYQTLALVAQALSKLEVGQISIAKFGETVDILHPFGETGFTDTNGASIMKSFTFDQQRTDVAALVDRSLTYLAEARQKQSSTSSPDLWQLEIIISDGVCQDHPKLRTLLRRALEERVMIVFIIIDSLQQNATSTAPGSARPSILSMQTVEYKNVNGDMQLEMTRYLDTFPFEFFVVLRDVEALPGVLADTLRQWMARVSQSQE